MEFKVHSFHVEDVLPEGFLYVGQDNYYIGSSQEKDIRYLYSDSATSCTIIIMEGKDHRGRPLVALSHLSRPGRFKKFFELVEEQFAGAVSIFVQGANPPQKLLDTDTEKYSYTSLRNAHFVTSWINRHTSFQDDRIEIPPSESFPYSWYAEQVTISLGLGNPTKDNRGDYGIDLNTMTVSNTRYTLTPEDRDPTGGLQTLFCVFGMQLNPPVVLHNVLKDFSHDDTVRLVSIARENNWEEIAAMSDAEILKKYSSTPQYEASWFCDAMRASSEYVINFKKEA